MGNPGTPGDGITGASCVSFGGRDTNAHREPTLENQSCLCVKEAEATATIIPFPKRLRAASAPTPRPRGIRIREQGKYTLAHCLQSGVIHEKYWPAFLELAKLIERRLP